ncbi:hypothetical protein SK066_05545 [Paenibacillus hunanensis]|uniref:hypothetical protein n=1 Tax=Paenibacillus hunanensis TaxID=539262 RepID=UPI002A6AEBC1|nr:hypothetical protein [Paenibacillus hunanensis]WPP42416.1 hypothetical protein SK066_05545 [Paenibacillus hunanensis]
MEYRCESCGDRSSRAIHRKEITCSKCGGTVLVDEAKRKSGSRKVAYLSAGLALVLLALIYYGY